MKQRLSWRAAPSHGVRATVRGVRVGLGIATDAIRAVAVRRGTVQWAIEASRDAEASLSEQITELLGNVSRRSGIHPRPKVFAAIGPAYVCTKRLSGVPPVADRRITAQLVREGAGRFFLGSSVPVVISVGDASSGEVWAAAFERPVIEAVVAACDAVGLSLEAIVPTVTVLGASTNEDACTWCDGQTCVHLRFDHRALAEVHRIPGDAGSTLLNGLVAPLLALGEDSGRFADAYAAAVCPPVARILAAPRLEDTPRQRSRSRVRIGLAAGSCVLALAAALLAPVVSAKGTERDARMELASIARQRTEAETVHENLRQVTAALDEVSRLTDARRSPLDLLAQLTAILPEGSAITTLRVDSTRGTLVVLTPRAMEVVSRLDTMSLIVTPEIVGPVTREANSGRELERITVRFMLAKTAPSASGDARPVTKTASVVMPSAASSTDQAVRRVR